MEWLCDQEWFKHVDIIQQIINNKQSIPEIEPKPEPKKKEKKSTVKISTDTESKIVEF